MTDHEMILLRAAVEALGSDKLVVAPPFDKWPACAYLEGDTDYREARTLADALTALLHDLGADVPEWPGEERVVEIRATLADGDWDTTDLPLPEYLALRPEET